MLKAVLFDMDGVIVDSEPTHQKIERELFADLGLAVSDEEHFSFVGTTTKDMWSCLKERYKLKQPVEELIRMKDDTYFNCLISEADVKSVPGVAGLIRELHAAGLKLAVASSASLREIGLILRMFDLEDFFDIKVSGEQVPRGKPAPDIFLHAAKRMDVLPEECAVIEDSYNGMQAAKSAGMKCVGLKNPGAAAQDLSSADLVIDSLAELNYRKIVQL